MRKILHKIKKVENLIFFAILFLAIIIRICSFPNNINALHVDEAMTAVNARAIANTGKDMYGASYPVFFEAWKWGGQTALLTYLMAISIKVIGFNLIAIRLPMLLTNIFSIIIIFLLTNEIFKNKKISLLAMFITAISPWHIMQTYYSLDCNMFPHITLLSIYLLCYRN